MTSTAARNKAAADDVLCMFTLSWISTTEPRPLTKLEMQLQHQLLIFLNAGILKDDLGDLSDMQLQATEQLQERDIVDAAVSAQVGTK